MTDAQRLQLAAATARKELRALALTDDASAEDIQAASAKVDDLEARSAVLSAAEEAEHGAPKVTGEDAEARERRELRGKARVADFVAAALTGRGMSGASAEYADAAGTPGLMPMELLETRAVTPGPAADTVTATRPTVPFAFSRTDAAALGIAMPMVQPGESHFPALTTAPPAGPKAKDAAADATAAAFTLTKRVPKRLTGSFTIRVEDLALLPSMESDLRNAISARMADVLDSQVIGGSGAGANLSGLLHPGDGCREGRGCRHLRIGDQHVRRGRGRQARPWVR